MVNLSYNHLFGGSDLELPIEQLIDAFLDGEYSFQFYFNKQTNEVFIPFEGEDIEDEEHIYPVPYKSSKEMYELMVEFSKQAEDAIEEKLFIALNKRKPFLNFKEILSNEDLLSDWHEFEHAYAQQQVLNWLESI